MRIISRAEWGARPPKSTPVYVPPSKRQYYVLHHSGGPVDQTVRAIQDWCMDGRGFNDIDYNFLVRGSTGEIYEGRGWDVQGAHTVGYNTVGAGVCIIGFDQCSDAAKLAVRWLYGEYNQRCGRTLLLRGHRDLDPPRDCPGDHNEAWLRAGLPAPTLEADMPLTDADLDGVETRVRTAIMGVLFDGQAAALGQASADTAADRAKRNVRDTMRAIVGGPVDQGAILAAVAGVDEAVWSKVPDPAVTVEEKAALLRDLINEFEPSRERSLAATKLDEAEMWLAKCQPTAEAQARDQAVGA